MNIIVRLTGMYMILCSVSLAILWPNAKKHYQKMMIMSDRWDNRIVAFCLLYFRAPIALGEALYHVVILKEDPTAEDYKPGKRNKYP